MTCGLLLASVDQLLQMTRIEQPQVLVSPIDATPTLQSVLAHLSQIESVQSLHIFSVENPSHSPDIRGAIVDISSETAKMESLQFPVSVYVEQAVDGNIQALVDVVAKLRDPDGGCPWDLKQTPQTLTKYILEEAYETVEAIQSENQTAIAEELGDLLLQVVLQSQIARENQDFSLATVSQNITDKLIRRHPHVFGDVSVNSVADVKANWEAIKAQEKGAELDEQFQVSQKMRKEAKTLPPMLAGLKLSKRAAEAGLEWPDLAGVWAKFYEELGEFQEALLIGSTKEQLGELGDLFFTLINVARWCKLDPSDALSLTNQKLIQRVKFIESQADKPLPEHTLEELDDLWKRAKQKLQAEKVLS